MQGSGDIRAQTEAGRFCVSPPGFPQPVLLPWRPPSTYTSSPFSGLPFRGDRRLSSRLKFPVPQFV